MRAVAFIGDSPSQYVLVDRLAVVTEVVEVVVSANHGSPTRPTWSHWARRSAGFTVGRPLRKAWLRVQERYSDMHSISRSVTYVPEINDPATIRAVAAADPDAIFVSGTNLLSGGLIADLAHRGAQILNLHTGISPYVKGGPNCANWCLAMGWFDRIGSTVMKLDHGIDTGAVIATERTPLDGMESLTELHWRVLEHAHDLYVRVAGRLDAAGDLPAVEQSVLGEGVTFYTRDWGAMAMTRALYNFHRSYRREISRGTLSSGIQLVDLT